MKYPGLFHLLDNRDMLTRQQERSEGRPPDAAVDGVSSWWIVAALLGALVLAVVAAVKAGALPVLPAKLVFALALPAFFAAALVAIGRDAPARSPALVRRRRSPADAPSDDDPSPDAAGDDPESGEAEHVYRWRHRRLLALGLSGMTAGVLAADARFSVHELERLLTAGCPLATALRILRPI